MVQVQCCLSEILRIKSVLDFRSFQILEYLYTHDVDILDKGAIHILSKMEKEDARFHPAAQNASNLKLNYLLLEFSIKNFWTTI